MEPDLGNILNSVNERMEPAAWPAAKTMPEAVLDALRAQVIGGAIAVHKALGP